MQIVFMGTPDFAVGALEALIAQGHEITAVVTQPDKAKGRSGQTYRKRPEDRDSRKHRRKRIVQRLHEKQNIRRKRRDWKQNTRSGWTSWNLNLWTRSPEFMNIFFM